MGVLWMVAANAAVSLGALSILHRVRSGRASLDLVLFLLCRYVLIAAGVLAAGLAHALAPLPLGLLACGGLGVWVATGEYRRIPDLPKVAPGALLGAVIAMIALRSVLQVWFFAPYSVDPLSYHLPKVAHWIQQCALLPLPGADVRETLPAGFELLEAWWAVFLHHDVLIEMAGVEFLLLGAASTVALARYMGLGPRASLFAAALYALVPAVNLQATACMNDGAVAAVVLSMLALAAFRVHPLLLLMSAAIGLGLKPTFAGVLPAAGLLWGLERGSRSASLGNRGFAVALAMLAIGIGSFWYLLNAFQHGNPLYPIGSLPTLEASGSSVVSSVSFSGRISDLAGRAVYDEADHFTVQFILDAGWGVATFACGGVALIAMARSNRPLRRLAAAFGLTLLVVLWMAPQGSFYFRYIVFFPALAALAIASLCETFPPFFYVAGIAAAFCFLSTLAPGDLARSDLKRLVRQGWRVRVRDPRFDDIPGDATVACLYGTNYDSNGESYLAYGPAFSRKVCFLDRIESVGALMAALRERRASWVFPQARNGDGTLRMRVLEAAGQGLLRKESGGLYRVIDR